MRFARSQKFYRIFMWDENDSDRSHAERGNDQWQGGGYFPGVRVNRVLP